VVQQIVGSGGRASDVGAAAEPGVSIDGSVRIEQRDDVSSKARVITDGGAVAAELGYPNRQVVFAEVGDRAMQAGGCSAAVTVCILMSSEEIHLASGAIAEELVEPGNRISVLASVRSRRAADLHVVFLGHSCNLRPHVGGLLGGHVGLVREIRLVEGKQIWRVSVRNIHVRSRTPDHGNVLYAELVEALLQDARVVIPVVYPGNIAKETNI